MTNDRESALGGLIDHYEELCELYSSDDSETIAAARQELADLRRRAEDAEKSRDRFAAMYKDLLRSLPDDEDD